MTAVGNGELGPDSANDRFDSDLAERLKADYGTDVWEDLNEWKSAALGPEGECIHYVNIRPLDSKSLGPEDDRNLLVIPGYLGGIQAYAPFAGAMAQRGYNVFLPHSDRADVTEAPGTQPVAARQQAQAIAAVIKDAKLQDGPLQVVAHSYGAIIFEELVEIAEEQGWSCFRRTGSALVAPAGIHEDSRPAFWWRSVVLGRLASVERFADDYRDLQGTAGRVGQELRYANPKRARQEFREVIAHRINLEKLQRLVGRLAVVPFAGDVLFPDSRFDQSSSYKRFSSLESALDNVVVFVPYSTQPVSKDRPHEIRGARGSDHSDIQANAGRVADSITSFLQSARGAD